MPQKPRPPDAKQVAALTRIATHLKARRREKELDLRGAARECGLSASTLSRLERGATGNLPDAASLTKLAAWLGVPVGSFFDAQSGGAMAAVEPAITDVVEVHLRADPQLSTEAAEALGRMFRALYEQMTREPK